ncbi:MAG: GAF domain-containing protein [Anaerolineales bacterium]|nr:GAF domain-containing protein [Anaerolineales bacterium]
MTTFPTRAWHYLTRPHPSISDVEQRRQSQLLAGLITVLIITSSVTSIFLIVLDGGITQTVQFLWVAELLTLGCYLVNRYGRYRPAATFFVGFNFLLTYSMPVLTDDLSWLWFTSMVVIFSAMLLPQWTTLIFVGGFGAHLLLGAAYPQRMDFSNFATTVVYTILGLFVLVFMSHRAGLERERQQELQAANEALRRSEAELEQRVAARTRDLRIAADVARQITTVLDTQALLPELVAQTKAAFGLHFVSIFLYQPDARCLVLAANTAAADSAIPSAARFELATHPSLVARAARERRHALVGRSDAPEVAFRNPHLPTAQSEAVFPMIVGDELIGVLSLQSEIEDRFGPDDVEIFGILAEQIAIAVKNAQLYETERQLAEELRTADRVKSQFLASMSHELRTPLNAIMNFTEMVTLEMMGPLNAEQKGLLSQSLTSSQHLLNLINDVLDISKIQAGRLALFVEDNVDLHAELETVLGMVRPLLNDKPVRLIEDVDDNLPRIAGDRRRIRQILLNLLTNAAKFTDAGCVTLSVKHRGDRVLFAVADTGPGIPAEMQTYIFEPFVQTKDGIKHAEGTGLGLPITRSLVEAHEGQLWLESEVGEGTVFYVTLPVRQTAA